MRISKRALQTQASPIRKLQPLALAAEKKGIEVIKLNIGQPDLNIPDSIFEEIKKYRQKKIPYAPSQGFANVIQAWQKYFRDFKLNFEENEIIVTTGASEAIIFALAAITDPRDEILVFEPFYTNYNGFAAINSIKLVPVPTKIETGFHLPSAKIIEKKITKKTRGIIICNPNNPTGAVYTRQELKNIVRLVKKYDLFVINDEVYREFVFGKNKFYSLFNFKEIEEKIILVDSVSKRFNLCGARIGCLAAKNSQVMENVLKFAQARLSSPTLEQSILIPLLKNSKKYTDGLIREYQKRRKTVESELKKIPGIVYHFPEGAFYIIIKLPIKDSEHFCRWLLEKFSHKKTTVMLAPASGFYATPGLGKNEVRLAFVYRQEILKKGLEILRIALEKYNKLNK
ncbi:MAG: pyridoxal phosphate-dependent aminotransferase [Patescibacteria group bacterium]